MSVANNSSFSFRVAESLKQEAFGIINDYGFTPSQVFNLFLTEIAKTKTIPINLSYLKPNAATLRAMKQAEMGELEIINCSTNENIAEALLKDIAAED